jgi:hypothetical protein
VIRVDGLPAGWRLASVTRGGTDVTDAAIDLSHGRDVTDIRLVLTNRSGALAGTLVDANRRPVAGGAVIVFAADGARWTYPSRWVRAVAVQQDGAFKAAGLPPGDYLIAHVTTLENGWDAPDSLEGLRYGAMPVRLTAGAQQTLTLPARRAAGTAFWDFRIDGSTDFD